MDSGDIVDQQLLQQFSCLGTTDKEELVRQLQGLVGNNVTLATAKFVLDMNNWNLQAAIGSYFDLFGNYSSKLPSMALDTTDYVHDTIETLPSTNHCIVWRLVNNGDEAWPNGCYLQFSGGDFMGNDPQIAVDPILPNCGTSVVVNLVSPCMPGVYKSHWRMATPFGTYFGETLWIRMLVLGSVDTELAKQLSNLNTCSDPNSPHRPDTSSLLNPFGSSQPNQVNINIIAVLSRTRLLVECCNILINQD